MGFSWGAARRHAQQRASITDPVEIVSAIDHRTHLITADAYGQALAARTGRYPAVCGHLVRPCSMTTPPGPACPLCTAGSRILG